MLLLLRLLVLGCWCWAAAAGGLHAATQRGWVAPGTPPSCCCCCLLLLLVLLLHHVQHVSALPWHGFIHCCMCLICFPAAAAAAAAAAPLLLLLLLLLLLGAASSHSLSFSPVSVQTGSPGYSLSRLGGLLRLHLRFTSTAEHEAYTDWVGL